MKKIVKYGIVGGGTYLLDLGSLYFFVESLTIHYLVSATMAVIIATFTNYYLNKTWSFNDGRKMIESLPQYLSLFIFNYLFLILALYIFVEFFGVDYLMVKIFAMSLIIIWNFLLYKNYIYKSKNYNYRAI